jgi:signal transduction histidine kinase
LKLSVQDSGRGFDFEKIHSNNDPLSGFGLANMQDRAEICGGKLEIRSEPQAGTTVELMLPCDAISAPGGLKSAGSNCERPVRSEEKQDRLPKSSQSPAQRGL